jgi:hypothetical protein
MTTVFSRAFRRILLVAALSVTTTVVIAATMITSAHAATTIGLGTAGSVSVLAGTGVTNTGPSVLNRDLDTWPTPAITGFPPGLVNGAKHAADAVAQQAQSDLTTAYNSAASAPSTMNETGVDLGGKTLTQGVYTASSSMSLTGAVPLTLNGSASSVFIFQAGTTLITGSGTSIVLTGGVTACNVFWQVGSSATLGTNSSFVGSILALQSISLTTGATVNGRALARNGAVTLDSNVFTGASCASLPTATTTTTVPSTTTIGGPTTTAAGSAPAPGGGASPGATPAPLSGGPPGGGGPTLTGAPLTPPLAATGLSISPLVAVALLAFGTGTGLIVLGNRRRQVSAD